MRAKSTPEPVSDGEVIAEWRLSTREILRVVVREFGGRTLIDLRRWYRDIDGNFRPGKGLALKPHDIVPMRKALRRAARHQKCAT